ncbi:MAG: Nif3-like dinuclear metal center hexameric protein [Myxococcota bacterium]
MELQRILDAAADIAPLHHAEGWDNVGLLVGDPAQDVRKAMLTIDYTPEVAREAQAAGCQLVLCYHPPIFQGLKRITAGSLVYDALRRGMALYSFHTALDVAGGGTNDVLADALGLTDRGALRMGKTPDLPGMGRIGTRSAISRRALVDLVKSALELPHVLVAGPLDGEVTRAACCAGACGDILEEAIKQRAEVYLTGEMRHHDALKLAALGMTVICTLHSNSERAVLRRLKDKLAARVPSLEMVISQQDRDPFQWV